MKKLLLAFFLPTIFAASVFSQDKGGWVVKAGSPAAAIQPTMWGIFFEDINMAADGGIYAELVKNRSFEFNMPLMGWKEIGEPAGSSILIQNRGAEKPDNPRYLRITHYSGLKYGISNEGFRGMGIKQGELYHFSLWDRVPGGADLRLHLELAAPDGKVIGEGWVSLKGTAGTEGVMGAGWRKDTVSFMASATEQKAHLDIYIEGQGYADLDMISLFPEHTWKQRPGGMRADLVQLLADMKPGFIRFPGGCIVEGRDLANRYQWKKTVGNVEDRKLIINRWNTEFSHRLTPDYYQSYGLGFFEYFQLAEDIGAEPLPILNCGMACQYNTAEVVPTDELEPYIQDALDLVEFANGPVTSKWGGLRAAMGHPAPFHMKLMGVGNEQWGPQYISRYKIFAQAIKARYPDIRLVNSVGPSPEGDMFNFLSDTLRKLHADIVDEHYYRNPEWFLDNAGRYDHYDRGGPKIFAGEYAAQSKAVVSPENRNNWQCALAEAAYMTGLERNADVVYMASYAPLFAHVDGWQWTPDLIWFDNLRSYGTPDYYVQKLYSINKGSATVPFTRDGAVVEGKDGLYGSACVDEQAHELILKLVNVSGAAQAPEIRIDGVRRLAASGVQTVLKDQLDKTNSLDNPMNVSPVKTAINCKGKKLHPVLAPYSFNVIRIRII